MSPNRVRQLRAALELTQADLAQLIGAQRHAVARWETVVNRPRGANLKLLLEHEAKTKKTRR